MSTIRDVAKLAGVSTATVSRVLNNDLTYKMTDETRTRVFDAVKQLDYKLSERFTRKSEEKASRRSASRQRTDKIRLGCILSVTRKKFNDPYFMSILAATENRMSERGYQISYIKTGSDLENSGQLAALAREHLTGLVLMENLSDETYKSIRSCVPYIVGIDTVRRDIDNIGYDHFEVATLAMKHLLEKGHKQIGFIGGHGAAENITEGQRYKGFYFMMTRAGLQMNRDWIIDCDWDEEICDERVDALCRSGNLPTAFFAASDLMAMACLNALYRNNISVPKKMAVVGISDIEVAKYSNPPLSTMHVPVEEMGIVAADMLIARIEGYKLLPQKIILPTELVERSST